WVEEGVLQSQGGRTGLVVFPGGEGDGLEPGQQVGCDVSGLSLTGLPAGEADAAALHETEEQLLLRDRVFLPDEAFEILAGEAARVSQPGYGPAAVEDRIDCIESPVLVEEDRFGEKVRLVENHPGLVEVVQGMLPGDDASDFAAKRLKLVEG